jgi:cathepsin F
MVDPGLVPLVALPLLALASAAVPGAEQSGGDLLHKFKEFVQHHGKEYASTEEMLARIAVYAKNLVRLAEMQQHDPTGRYSHKALFMDLSEAEFKARNTLQVPADLDQLLRAAPLDTSANPASLDWRAKGAVQAIKNQAQCGSCWAFSTASNIESAIVVQGKGQLLSLSEQQLVDCDKQTGDQGCNGGLPTNAFKDMLDNKFGLDAEKDYGYTGRSGSCRSQGLKQYGFINSYKVISTDEDQIAAALVTYGPLSIGINAGPMQFYFGGIADPWTIFCNPRGLDHAVNIVGYGVESKKYWIIRNSWGTSWGEQGYYRIVRGVGKCGLNRMVATAVVSPKLDAPPQAQYV